MPLEHEIFKNKQGDPNRDRGISDIKGWKVVGPHKEIEKINNKSKLNPVDQITNGATGDQGQSHGIEAAVATEAPLGQPDEDQRLSLIHISEPTRRTPISYAV